MSFVQRLALIKRIEDYLIAFDEHEVDSILGNAGSTTLTPSGWGFLPEEPARHRLRELLGDLNAPVIDRLAAALPPEALTARLEAIADALVQFDASTLALTLKQAGAADGGPSGWDGMPGDERHQSILGILRRQPAGVLEPLSELAPEATSIAPAPEPVEPPPEPTPEPAADPSPAPVQPAVADSDAPIFLVHGHAQSVRHETARMLEKATERDVIVLHEQPNGGATILEKFERHAERASYAVVLLTADDEGGVKTSESRQPRGRQNVIFELGFFFAKLGRDRVAVLLEQGVEEPSDIKGLLYIPIDAGGAWKQRLARELDSAGIHVMYDKIPPS